MNRQQSREDYLEAILQLSLAHQRVKSIDVDNKLGFSKPSVSVAVKKLKDEGFITIEKDGTLLLTESGEDIARKTLEKHEFLTKFFIEIGVDPIRAEEEACEIEHSVSFDTFQKLKNHLNK